MTSCVSATMRIRSPSPAPVCSMIARWVSSDRNLAIGLLTSPPGSSDEVGQALGPEPPGALGQLVDLAPGDAGHAGRDDRLDPAAAPRAPSRTRRTPSRRRRPAPTSAGAEVDQLHPEADVRLVRAEPLERLLVGHHRERRLEDRSVRDGRPRDLDRHRLDEGHHRRLVDEAHLEVELGELGLAVAAQVLVAVAPGDLHVAVDAGDHQQLLELLRALRQGVDGARLEPARDDEVAGALGRALDQRRRLDLDEAVGVVDLADGLDHPAAEHQPALHRLAPDVEVAVLEAQDLVDRRVRLVDVERRRLRLGQDRRPRSPGARSRRSAASRSPCRAGAARRCPRRTPRTRGGPGWPPRGRPAHRPCR